MVFDKKAFLQFEDDARYNLLNKTIKADSSNASLESSQIPPQTAPSPQSFPASVTVAGVSIPSTTGKLFSESVYNNGASHYIDVYLGSSYKANLSGFYLMMKYSAYQYRALAIKAPAVAIDTVMCACPIPPSDATGYSIPFDPAYWFQNIYLQSGSDNSTIEQYVFGENKFGDLSMVRHLQEIKGPALEQNSMSFFTPCIESKFDDTSLSLESIKRAQTWLCGNTNSNSNQGGSTADDTFDESKHSIKTNTKMIPLSLLLSTCRTPGFLTNSAKVRLQFTMKNGDNIPFCCGPTTVFSGGNATQTNIRSTYNTAKNCSPVYIGVTGMTLLTDSARVSALQAIDLAEDHKENQVCNIGFNEYYPIPSISSQQIVVTGQSQVNTAILGYPAWLKDCTGGTNTNFVQSAQGCVQNYSQHDSGNATSISILYGTDQMLKQPMRLDNSRFGSSFVTNAFNNTIAYTMYVKSCNADLTNSVVPLAIPFDRFQFYNFYFLPIYPTASGVHITTDARDIRIDNTADTGRSVTTIVKKFGGVQIASDGSVSRFN